MRTLRIVLTAALLLFGSYSQALAADGHGPDWLNFGLRVATVLIVAWIIKRAAGSKISAFLSGHKEAVVREMDEAARLKKEAEAHLADIEARVANAEAECKALLEEGKAQGEALKAAIIAEAEKQATAIVEQARRTAEQEGKAELDAIRAALADDIVAAVEKGLVQRLDVAEQERLIDKSLGKVVIQ